MLTSRALLAVFVLFVLSACQTTEQASGCTSRSPLVQFTDMLRSIDDKAPPRKGPSSVEEYFSDCVIFAFLTAAEQYEVHQIALHGLSSTPVGGEKTVNWSSEDGQRDATIRVLPEPSDDIVLGWLEVANAQGGSFDPATVCRPVITLVERQAQTRATGLAYCEHAVRGWTPVGEIDPSFVDPV
ncbi:hypothetical protein [Thalassospira sp. CH_XMU1420-2]|jgi:hypothetical protein|uniref:hypothetical protein n=1 Tax=Thalassospira sp. CH_XMU1420-2 TaxID=3107769 RepID=UPI0030090103|tara:strand:+ start:4289 stop:4840 length:552 start_codon:yes stop_codon:yes gene_type:complete